MAELEEQSQEPAHGAVRLGSREEQIGVKKDPHQCPTGNYRRPDRAALDGTLRPLCFAFNNAASSPSAASNSCSRFTE